MTRRVALIVVLALSVGCNAVAGIQLARQGWEANLTKRAALAELETLPAMFGSILTGSEIQSQTLMPIYTRLIRTGSLMRVATTVDHSLVHADSEITSALFQIDILLPNPHTLGPAEVERVKNAQNSVQVALDELTKK